MIPARIAKEPGLYPGTSYEQYEAFEGIRCSLLKELHELTPAEVYYALTHPKPPTQALSIGDACHAAILQPDVFTRDYARVPKWDLRRNADKAAKEAFEAEFPNKIALSEPDYDMAAAMRDAVWKNPCAAELLQGGQNEIGAVWTDAETGLTCKCRMDHFGRYHSSAAVVDVKTAQEIAPRPFSKAIYDYCYHWSAAYYLDGLAVLAPARRRFVHIAIKKAPPYCVAVYELEEPDLREGRAQYRAALTLWAECLKRGEYPGHPIGIQPISLPKWAYELTNPEKL